MNHAGRRSAVRITMARACVVLAMVGVVISGCTSASPAGSGTGSDEPTPVVPGASPTPVSLSPVRASFVEVATGRVRPLPRGLRTLHDASNYRVAPDGSAVVFDGVGGDGPQLFLGSLDGGPVRQLTQEPVAARDAALSPDGSTAVYVAGEMGTSLKAVDVTGRVSTVLVEERRGRVYRPSISPDGETVLFTLAARNPRGGWRTDLWAVPIEGGEPERVIRHGAYGEYSPDGSMIAYQPTATAGPQAYCGDCWWVRREPIVVPADGSAQPGPNPGGNLVPAVVLAGSGSRWSPDGTSIAFTGLAMGSPAIYVMRVDTRRVEQVGVGWQPTWFDDDTLIVTDYGEVER